MILIELLYSNNYVISLYCIHCKEVLVEKLVQTFHFVLVLKKAAINKACFSILAHAIGQF